MQKAFSVTRYVNDVFTKKTHMSSAWEFCSPSKCYTRGSSLKSSVGRRRSGLFNYLLPRDSLHILEAIEKFWFDGSTHRSH